MTIKNKTSNDITVMIYGETYTVPAEGQLSNVPNNVAEYWQTLHSFIVVTDDAIIAPKVTVGKEEKEEKPKKITTKK